MKRTDDGERGGAGAPAEATLRHGHARSCAVHILKVRHQDSGEVRRLRASWPRTASNSEALDVIRRAVEAGFPGLRSPALSYLDCDDDRCVPVLETLEDCLSFARA